MTSSDPSTRAIQHVMLLYSGMSLVGGVALIVAPSFAWNKLFHVRYRETKENSYVSTVYGAAMLGEACLQLVAGSGEDFLVEAALLFMIPYKIGSAVGLAIQAIRGKVESRAAFVLSMQWLAALGCLPIAAWIG